MPDHSRITAATGHDGGPTIPTLTVCDSVSWVVEVSKGYQSVHIYIYISAPTRDYYNVMICNIRKIHRLHKKLPCAIHGFLREVRIHRLRSAIHGSARSTDCAQHIVLTHYYGELNCDRLHNYYNYFHLYHYSLLSFYS